jgi:hypothetical protein
MNTIKLLNLVGALLLPLFLCGLTHAQDTETHTGTGALASDKSSSDDNTADGYQSLNVTTQGKGTGNTAIGYLTLSSNTSGFANTAIGEFALESNTTGSVNTASGAGALQFNTDGYSNTASGVNALLSNVSGSQNTATGAQALESNTSGYNNSATGYWVLLSNTTGSDNTATGYAALVSNTTGTANTANGVGALSSATTASNNTADGFEALAYSTTGSNNTAMGYEALYSTTGSSGYGGATGSDNIAIGYQAGSNVTAGSHNIIIGPPGVGGDAKTIRLGKQGLQDKAIIAGIFGKTVVGGVAVYIDYDGRLGTVTSSAKFKRNIHDMGSVSDALMSLRPVTFQYKSDIDPTGTPQFGLIAEEVEKVNPDLVVRDADHQIYSVRYEAVNAMLLNEFQKEHQTIVEQQKHAEEQDKTIADQRAALSDQGKSLAEQQKLLQSLAGRLEQIEQTQAARR